MTSSNRGALAGQIENRNYLSPVGFKFSLAKFPKVDFFCNSASIPEITLGTYQQPSYLKNIDVPGEKLTYGDLDIRFLVDENMENYSAVHNWLTGLGFPETPQQFINKTTDTDGQRDLEEQFMDLDSKMNQQQDPVLRKLENQIEDMLTRFRQQSQWSSEHG